mgnify:CR=1 FL=1
MRRTQSAILVLAVLLAGGSAAGAAEPVVENGLGFRTLTSGEVFSKYWESLKERHRLTGEVAEHITREGIESILVLEVNIAIAAPQPKYPGVADHLLAFLAEGNRFDPGPLPEGFERHKHTKYVAGVIRTASGEYGLVTIYPGCAVVGIGGRVGIAPAPEGEPRGEPDFKFELDAERLREIQDLKLDER